MEILIISILVIAFLWAMADRYCWSIRCAELLRRNEQLNTHMTEKLPAAELGRKLLIEQAVTIGRSGADVSIQCDDTHDADAIIAYLLSMSWQLATIDYVRSKES